jgi:lycopene beta-cyclase
VKREYDYIISGGGGSGLITAYRMSRDPWFDDKEVLIIEKENKNSNDRTWCYWEEGTGEWDGLLNKKWNKIYFGSPGVNIHTEIIPFEYKMLRSKDLYSFLKAETIKKKNFDFHIDNVSDIRSDEISAEVVTSGGTFRSNFLLNSIPQFNPIRNESVYPYLKQHFVGWFIQTEKPTFNPDEAVFMDFNIPQNGNTRFIYVLPLSETEALVEYTLFSEQLLEFHEYEDGIRSYLEAKGIEEYSIIEKESGNIPMTCFPFHMSNSERVLHIGSAGGWTKASTGFTFANISKKTKKLIPFLKTSGDMRLFHKPDKYHYYDRIFIEVLSANNACGTEIFSSLFKSVPVQMILKFLNDETTLSQDLRIILQTQPKSDFTMAFFRSVFKQLYYKM